MTDSGQTSLFDSDEGKRRRDEAVDRVGRNAEPAWKAFARLSLDRCSTAMIDFTSDDVWFDLDETLPDEVEPPHERRAMGAIFTEAFKAGKIIPADKPQRPSSRPVCHRNPKRVWRRA